MFLFLRRLPSWARSFVPRIFYVTEKAWNYYPFTITEYTVSFLERDNVQNPAFMMNFGIFFPVLLRSPILHSHQDKV